MNYVLNSLKLVWPFYYYWKSKILYWPVQCSVKATLQLVIFLLSMWMFLLFFYQIFYGPSKNTSCHGKMPTPWKVNKVNNIQVL